MRRQPWENETIEPFNRNAVAPALLTIDVNDATALRLRIIRFPFPQRSRSCNVGL